MKGLCAVRVALCQYTLCLLLVYWVAGLAEATVDTHVLETAGYTDCLCATFFYIVY